MWQWQWGSDPDSDADSGSDDEDEILYSGSDTSICIHPTTASIPPGAFGYRYFLAEVELPAGLRDIGDEAFEYCTSLKKIILPEGLLRIGSSAFEGCRSLTHIKIPSTVTIIQMMAFARCILLRDVHIEEGVVTIGEGAFRDCSSLPHINIPSTVTGISRSAFKNCSSLRDVNLCEGLLRIGFFAFCETTILRINIPASIEYISHRAFTHCPLMLNIAVSPSSSLQANVLEQMKPFRRISERGRLLEEDCSMDTLKSRFDGLPLHRFCFYHTHPTMGYTNAIAWLDNYTQHPLPVDDSEEFDCLGMTPLHILACTGVHNKRLYQRIFEIHPDAMELQDHFSKTPFDYVLLSNAPMEIFHFFLDTMRKKWGTIPFDFDELVFRFINTLHDIHINSGNFVERLRQLVQGQRTYFPDLKVDWVWHAEFAKNNVMHLGVYRVLLEASQTSRSKCMSSEHERLIDFMIERNDRKMIKGLILRFIKLHKNLTLNATSILELALWKVLLDESAQENQNDDTNALKRKEIRLNGGKMFQVVIPNVFSFLF